MKILWLVVYWLGAAIGSIILLFTVLLLVSAAGSKWTSADFFIIISLAAGSIALVAGAVMATFLLAWGLQSAAFPPNNVCDPDQRCCVEQKYRDRDCSRAHVPK